MHRVTIETRTEVSDGHDGFTEQWVAQRARIAASIQMLAGRDLERAKQIDPRATYELRLRFWLNYRTDLAAGRARIIWHDGNLGDRTLEVVEPPRETERRMALTMICKEQG